MKFDKVFIYTMAEEFYFTFDVDQSLNGCFTLMHRGYNGWSKMVNEYHKQHHKLTSPYDVIDYIIKHTKSKYGV
jgi:hypothetical protein